MELLAQYSNLLVIGIAILALLITVMTIARWYKKTSPDVAMIISGRGSRPRIVVGGGTLVLPILEQIGTVSLENRTITVQVKGVLSQEAVPVNVEAVVQVKIGGDEEQIRAAAARFLGKTADEIHGTILDTLGGHLRAIIAKMTAEEVFKDREGFAKKVLELSAEELARLGFVIDSFVIREISDDNGYYESLGRQQIANVKRDADIATAEADRETREKVAAAARSAQEAELQAETLVAAATKDRDVKTSGFKTESEHARADAEVAFPLQAAARQRELAEAEGQVAVVREEQAAAAARVAVQVAEQRQEAEIVIPAKAARSALVEQAEGQASAVKAAAGAEAERIRVTRTAQADGIKAEGTAEAEVVKAKLLGQAEGEQQLAEARSSQEEVNFRLDAIRIMADAKVKIGEAVAMGMNELGKGMKIVQFSGGNNGSGGGNALVNGIRGLPGLLAEVDASADALFGVSIGSLLRGKFGGKNNGAAADDEEPAAAAHASEDPPRE